MQRYFLNTIFISGVLLLLHIQIIGNLRLAFVVILTQISNSFIVIHIASARLFDNFSIQFINCIDFTINQLYNGIKNDRRYNMRAKDDASILSKIWDTMQMIDAASSKGGAETIRNLELLENQIADLLNDEGGGLFQSYMNLSSELKRICEQEAFESGVKFATAYILEAQIDK